MQRAQGGKSSATLTHSASQSKPRVAIASRCHSRVDPPASAARVLARGKQDFDSILSLARALFLTAINW